MRKVGWSPAFQTSLSKRIILRSYLWGGRAISNRISILGSVIATFGFFFLPLLEIKPNRLASGIPVNLFEIPGDTRFLVLFILALLPIALSFMEERGRRGWSLVIIGNLLIFLTLLLSAGAGIQLLEGSEALFEEGTRISNPRIFTSSAIALGLLGGYIVLFGGLRDLVAEKTASIVRLIASLIGPVLVLLMLLSGTLDIFSIMVEFYERGATLGQRFIEHFVFVLVSLAAGLVIGIALGLWAARDERVEDMILYTVGIIQTIPSLALFGVLLVPLARLGDRAFVEVAGFILMMLVVGLVLLFFLRFIQGILPERLRSWSIILSFAVMFIPLALITILLITFGFRVILNIFLDESLRQVVIWVALGVLQFPVLLWLGRRIEREATAKRLRYVRYGLLALSLVGLLYLGLNGAGQVIRGRQLADITIRNLGVSGIGTAPAIIALTLYSLLPLVRNTYAGLKNVDPAIIDSGKGMGMTAAQIFFQIELPLALPIIMAGVRNAAISLVGIAAVASIIGAGALGDFILLGVNTTSVDLILLGAIPAIILAVVLDALLQILEGLLISPGIQRPSQ